MTFSTIVFGGFRGLVADILWLRAAEMKQNGKYVELVQLADWITKLEPRCSEVWEFHAWNMAYNVSVMMPEPEDGWRWVNSGIELVRERGLYYNPSDARLFWYLGWLYQHKIGADFDRNHLFYKKKWAETMAPFLNGPHPDFARISASRKLRKTMRERYLLLPDIMKDIEKAYGPLDWRKPETYAIYCAFRGKPHAEGFNLNACNRMIRQCLRILKDKNKE